MAARSLSAIRELTLPRDIEESRGFRIATWASICVSIAALAARGMVSTSLVLLCILLITLGFWVSWQTRYRPKVLLKLAIAGLTLVALASFLRQSYLQPYDPRIPLAELFLWVQVLHSFDLPRRRDLLFSLVSSFILLALAASFSLSVSFVWIILLWLTSALPCLYLAQRSRLASLSHRPQRLATQRPSLRSVTTALFSLLVAVCVAGLVIGVSLPRVSLTYMRSLPFSLRRAFFSAGDFHLTNPGYPDLPSRPPDSPLPVNPEAYFGFGTFLDLRVRGEMLDLPVMKVRATRPAYWGGLRFSQYNGYSWLPAEDKPARLEAPSQPFTILSPPGRLYMENEVNVQTFYMESEQPNVIFAAYRPTLIYFPADALAYDSSGFKAPFILSEGLVYSVVSRSVDLPDRELAGIGEVSPGEDLAPYLSLPDLPRRVVDLVGEILPADAGPFERAMAIEQYLKTNYQYSLDVPALPEGSDAVDRFLFEDRRGYCEHFASAYAVLCRLAGIPSRVVTGYSTGDYDPFSGLYEVGLDDAHAWVEIYLDGVGWVTREPTPGFSLPGYGGSFGISWIFRDFIAWAGRNLAPLLPPSLRTALRKAFSAVHAGALNVLSGLSYSVRYAPWLPLLLLSAIAAPFLLRSGARRRRSASYLAACPEGPLRSMELFLREMEALGLVRDPSRTAMEILEDIARRFPGVRPVEEFRLYESVRYGGRELDGKELARFSQGLAGALRAARRSRSALFYMVKRILKPRRNNTRHL